MWCVFCSFIQFLSAFCVIHRKDLVLLNLISIYVTSATPFIWLLQHHLYDFCKVIFEKERYSGPLSSKFLFQQVIYSVQYGVAVMCTGRVMYIYMSVSSLLVAVCRVCLYVWYQIRVVVNNHVIRVKPTVNMKPCCIKHSTRCYWYWVTKAPQS